MDGSGVRDLRIEWMKEGRTEKGTDGERGRVTEDIEAVIDRVRLAVQWRSKSSE